MENLFANLAISSVSFVGKAAFSFATSMAVKQINTFVQEKSRSAKSLELEALEKKLTLKLSVITPSIDLCEIIASKGNTSLVPILEMSTTLKEQLNLLSKKLVKQTSSIINTKDKPSESISSVISDFRHIMDLIDEIVPFIQLALSTTISVANTSTISPSRLMQASSAFSIAAQTHTEFQDKKIQLIPVGPEFIVKLYSLFTGSIREKKTVVDWTWKEDFVKSTVQLKRKYTPTEKEYFEYILEIKEDLNDGRYHDDDEKARVESLNSNCIRKMYYANSGKLLNISDCRSSVIVLKVEDGFEDDGRWIALELFKQDEGEDSDSDEEGPLKIKDAEDEDERGSIFKKLHLQQVGSLSLLEYMIRLSSAEIKTQTSHLFMTDEKIAMLLSNDFNNQSPDVEEKKPVYDLKESFISSPFADGVVGRVTTPKTSVQTPGSTYATPMGGSTSPLQRKSGRIMEMLDQSK